MKTLIFITFWMTTLAFGQSNYGDQRGREDTRPETMRARRTFSTFINQYFNMRRNQLGLTHITLSFNQRMIAQRGRGAATAHNIIPREIDQVMQFILEARRSRASVHADLASNYRTLHGFSREEISSALTALATTRQLHLEYWGYISRQQQAPDFNLSTGQLTYYTHWNEAESSYVLYGNRQMRSNIIRGLIARLNHVPWYERIF